MATSSVPSNQIVADLRVVLTEVADATQQKNMAAYMKDQFPFLGVKTPARRAAAKPLLAAAKAWSAEDLLDVADALFDEPEREFQYVAGDLLRRWAGRLGPSDLARVRRLIETKSWWDTVDALAVHVVGEIVRANRSLQEEMDRWVDDENLWIARTAILHQLLWKSDTDTARLFGYCRRRGGDGDFFIRKALGWALRQYARTDPDAVRAFVAAHAENLSALTKREALRHIDR